MNKVLAVLEKLYNLILINALIILFSVPVVTILPAFAAGSITTSFWMKDEEISIIKTFFSSFMKSLKAGALRGFVLTFWGITFYLIFKQEASLNIIVQGLVLFLVIEWFILLCGSFLALKYGKYSFLDAFIIGHKQLIEILLVSIFVIITLFILSYFKWLSTLYLSGVMASIIYLKRGFYAHKVQS